MARWPKYSGEEIATLRDAVRSPGLSRYLLEVEEDGLRDLVDDLHPVEARARVKMAREILGLDFAKIQSIRKEQGLDLTTGLK